MAISSTNLIMHFFVVKKVSFNFFLCGCLVFKYLHINEICHFWSLLSRQGFYSLLMLRLFLVKKVCLQSFDYEWILENVSKNLKCCQELLILTRATRKIMNENIMNAIYFIVVTTARRTWLTYLMINSAYNTILDLREIWSINI